MQYLHVVYKSKMRLGYNRLDTKSRCGRVQGLIRGRDVEVEHSRSWSMHSLQCALLVSLVPLQGSVTFECVMTGNVYAR
jgi:hypothetical protein